MLPGSVGLWFSDTAPMSLGSLVPPPSALEPEAPPPWPEPSASFHRPVLPRDSIGCGFLMGALVPTAIVFFTLLEGNYAHTKLAAAVFVLLVVVGLIVLGSGKTLRRAHEARFERSRRCWARVMKSEVKGEVNDGGVLTHYVLNLELQLWEAGGLETPHRSAPRIGTPLHEQAKVPAALGPHVVPGAFFAVMFDPVEQRGVPFTLVTKDGVQFSVP